MCVYIYIYLFISIYIYIYTHTPFTPSDQNQKFDSTPNPHPSTLESLNPKPYSSNPKRSGYNQLLDAVVHEPVCFPSLPAGPGSETGFLSGLRALGLGIRVYRNCLGSGAGFCAGFAFCLCSGLLNPKP